MTRAWRQSGTVGQCSRMSLERPPTLPRVQLLTKEYVEDLGTIDRHGYYDYAYRYWDYVFDLDGRRYGARIYTDEPEATYVTDFESSRPRQYDDDLRVIAEYMRGDANVTTVKALGASGGYEPVITFE